MKRSSAIVPGNRTLGADLILYRGAIIGGVFRLPIGVGGAGHGH
jgi:hypothetical protein